MRRRLFTLAATVSLVSCVAVCIFWVRSYRVGEAVYREAASCRLAVLSGRGQCSAFRTTYPASAASPPVFDARTRWRYSDAGGWADVKGRAGWYRADPGVRNYGPLAGFGYFHKPAGPKSMGADTREVYFPYWFLVLLTAAGPAAWVHDARRRRRLRRRSLDLCPSCGYDLRATPDRCPECGAVATAAGAAP